VISGARVADIAELKRIIEPEVEAEGLALVRVMMIGGKDDPTLQVMAERPDTRQLNLADCERLHRRIVERHDVLTDEYRIEVSSPGIDRPLTRPQDFEDWKGFEARLNLAEKIEGRKQYSGALLGLAGEDVLIDVDGLGERRVPIASLHSAKLLFTDKLVAATAPLNPDGAEEIDDLEELTEEQD
jgi:ribosome maturation factor RimP